MADKFTRMDERLYGYLLDHQSPEHELLRALRRQTEKLPRGHMQITPEQGHLLALLVRLMGTRRILEVGTFTGYSALAMALAFPEDGRIITCDLNEEWTQIARDYWQSAGVLHRIELRIAPAVETLALLDREGSSFDLAFLDADKTGYDAYYESALRLVRPGGLIVLDNMLRRGRVAHPDDNDPDTVALRKLNA